MAHDLTPHDIRRVAVVARKDPRTVARMLAGEPIRPGSRDRIMEALAQLGWTELAPPGTPMPYGLSAAGGTEAAR